MPIAKVIKAAPWTAADQVVLEACQVMPKRGVGAFAIQVRVQWQNSAGFRIYIMETASQQEQAHWVRSIEACRTGRTGKAAQGQATRRTAAPATGVSGGVAKAASPPVLHPKSAKAQKIDIVKQPWFRPAWSPDHANKYLERAAQGAFVMRDAPGRPGDFALGVQTGQQICTVLVCKSKQGRPCWAPRGSNNWFESVLDLVLFHCINPLVFGPTIRITLSLSSARQAQEAFKMRRTASVSAQPVPPTRDVKVASAVSAPAPVAAAAPAPAAPAGSMDDQGLGVLKEQVQAASDMADTDAKESEQFGQRFAACKATVDAIVA